jgi:acyl-CoA reductase-like NAD-dependent aldehyde dehydrogenase
MDRGSVIGNTLFQYRHVDAISFTRSAGVGRGDCDRMRHLAQVSATEDGGKEPTSRSQ